MKLQLFFILSFLLTLQFGCKKDEPQDISISKPYVTFVSNSGAITNVNFSSTGKYKIISGGGCYSLTENPTISNDTVSGNIGTANISVSIYNLLASKTYFYKAFLITDGGVFYSEQISFITSGAQVPSLTTKEISSISSEGSVSGGFISQNGGANIIEKGLCWSTSPNPTINDGKSINTSNDTNFYVTLTGLNPLTKYYVRAYATNSGGTGYGSEKTFTTFIKPIEGAGVTDIDGNNYKTIIIGNQEWMAENLKVTKYSNGDALTTDEYGVYENIASNTNTYGLYYSMSSLADARNVCPDGWRAPTRADYDVLFGNYGKRNAFLGFDLVGGYFKSLNLWEYPNLGATNISKFNTLPAGYYGNGAWKNKGINALFHVVPDAGTPTQYNFYVLTNYNSEVFLETLNIANFKGSVRCIKK